jgi:hypothetical protein
LRRSEATGKGESSEKKEKRRVLRTRLSDFKDVRHLFLFSIDPEIICALPAITITIALLDSLPKHESIIAMTIANKIMRTPTIRKVSLDFFVSMKILTFRDTCRKRENRCFWIILPKMLEHII